MFPSNTRFPVPVLVMPPAELRLPDQLKFGAEPTLNVLLPASVTGLETF